MEFRGRRTPPRDGAQLHRRAGRPGGGRPRAAPRDARTERRIQPGLGLPGARHPGRRTPLLGGHRRRPRPAPTLAARHDACAGGGAAVLEQERLPRALRRGRQGLDRPRRAPLAGAVLAHGRRHGLPADPADRRRRGARRVLLRRAQRPRRRVARGASASRRRTSRSARSRWATRHRRRERPARPRGVRASRWRRSSTAAPGAHRTDMRPVHRTAGAGATRDPRHRSRIRDRASGDCACG